MKYFLLLLMSGCAGSASMFDSNGTAEQKMVLDYFYYSLTTEDLIDMILNRAQPRDIFDLVEALKREAS